MWFLIYDTGFSLKDMSVFLNFNPEQEPRHYRNNGWWNFVENQWANYDEEPNYYLLEVTGDYKGKGWKEQEKEIANSGQEFQRASTRLMISLSIAWFLSKGVYLQKTCYHWGPESGANGVRCASCFDEKGFALFNWNELCPKKNLGTFIIRKFDF